MLRPGGVALFITDDGQVINERIVKPWPAEMDEWSHWEHGADGNPVSMDSVVGPPRELQWIAGPRYSKQHWGPRQGAAVTTGGRLFTIEDDTPTSRTWTGRGRRSASREAADRSRSCLGPISRVCLTLTIW